MKGKIVDVGVGSDLYVAGRSCDGHDYIAETYFVYVEIAGGEVYAHNHWFPGCAPEMDDEGITHFGDIRVEAQAKAERLCERVKAAIAEGKPLDEAHWNFHRTVYGSNAYLQEVAEMTPRQRAGEPD